MGNKNNKPIIDSVIVGLFAAVTFLGIQVFRVPLPAAVGVPFLHFGNIFLLLGALLMGGKKGAFAGAVGFCIFDILNGYITVIPKVVILAILMCLVASRLFEAFKGKWGTTFAVAFACLVAFLISLIGDFLYDTGLMLFAGSELIPAMWAAFTSLLATAINAVFGVIAVTVLYPILKMALKKANINLVV